MTAEPTYEYRVLNVRGSQAFTQTVPIVHVKVADAYRIVKDASDPTAAPHRVQRRTYIVSEWEDVPDDQ